MPNESEFIRVIKESEGIIFKIAMLYAADRDDQKDLYQEIVYQLWRSFDSFRSESKISTWIYRIALNTSITHLRREKRRGPKVAIDEAVMNRFDHDDNAMEERLTQLYDQIRKLSTIEKGIVLLHLEGKNYEEIATITGFTATNVGTRLSRIKDKLRSQLKD